VEEMREIGSEIASHLRAGDVVVLRGELGAGKTAFTQGVGRALGISNITSPTFVIARTHQGNTPLIHVDAYRLTSSQQRDFEFDDLDLEMNRDEAITIIEWGSDVAPRLSDEFLTVSIEFGESENNRIISVAGSGKRWEGFSL
jgi:tRNA threonylcarbamoyladenosine biosynthesis protein TsaE